MPEQDQGPLLELSTATQAVARFVGARHAEVLHAWAEAVRKRPAARDLSDAGLAPRVTPFLEWMAAADGASLEPIARELAVGRLQEGLDLGEVFAQYSLLRDCLIDLWYRTGSRSEACPGSLVIHHTIDGALAAAVAEYSAVQDRTLSAIETVSMATLESAGLDDLLHRLLVTFQEVAPAIDTVAIYLCEAGQVRLHAAVGVPFEAARGYSVKLGEGLAGRVAAERRALFVSDASADPVPLHPLPTASSIRAAYGVPLLESHAVVGVAVMGSYRAWEFSKADRVVFETIARRATGAIYFWKVREAIATEKTRIEALLGQIPAGVILAEAPSGKMTLHNNQVELIWRRPFIACPTIEDYRAWPAQRLDGRWLEPDEWALARAIRKGEMVINQEIEILRGDGSRGTILANAAPIRAPDGRIVGGVTAFIDISEKRLTERQLKETAAYAQRGEVVQNLIAQASQALAESFVEGTAVSSILRLALPRLADWCGVYLADTNDQLKLVEIAHVDPRRAELTRQRLRNDPSGGRAGRDVYDAFLEQKSRVYPVVTDELLVQWATSSGQLELLRELGLVSVILMPLVARGRSLGVLVFASAESRKLFGPEDLLLARELARRSAFAIDNERLYEKAQQEVHLREDLLAIISHDLRSPLAAVLLNATQLASHPAVAPGTINEEAEAILKAARRMGRLIRDLVDFAAIGVGRLTIEKALADPAAITAEAIASFGEALRRRGVVLTPEVEAGLPWLSCDRLRLVQVLENLLSNALKATAAGGQVTLRAIRSGDQILFSVADTGSGISAEEQVHIFDRYYRGRGSRGEGLGLGLAIAKTLVEGHGGRIWVESTPGQGSVFSFLIPLGAS